MSENDIKKRIANIEHVLLTGYITVEVGDGNMGTRPLTNEERKELEEELQQLNS